MIRWPTMAALSAACTVARRFEVRNFRRRDTGR
jgi:hypothetical protein